MADKTPPLLTAEQRLFFTTIPEDLSAAELARYYTLLPEDLTFIQRQHGSANRLGMALQLCSLRFPGRPLTDLPAIPAQFIRYVAHQLQIDPSAFARYGERSNTLYEHLDRLRQHYGYRNYGWSVMLQLARHLLPTALESDDVLPLVEAALVYLRAHRIIVPGLTTLERLLGRVQRLARRRVYKRLTGKLTRRQTKALDDLLQVKPDLSGLTRLAWLRLPPGKPSAESMDHLLECLAFVRTFQLPAVPETVHPNQVRQLAQRCRRYKAQPLANFEDAAQRYAFLVAYLTDLAAELTDQIIDLFDRWLLDLNRRGRNAQKHHLYKNVTTLNHIINTFTAALAAFLEARQKGQDPVAAILAVADEETLTATITAARATMRPANMDYRDLLENRYTRRRKALLQMYRALSFEAVSGDSAKTTLAALDYVVMLQDRFNKRVRTLDQVIQEETMTAPLDHLKWTRWKGHALDGQTINPNYYELGAWHRLKDGLRSGDIAVTGSRRYQAFDSYLLPPEKWQQLKAADQTRLAVGDDPQKYLHLCQETIETLFAQLVTTLAQGETLTLDEAGELHLKRPVPSTPPEAVTWRDTLYARLPLVELADLVIEVAAWTHCLAPFTHLVSEQPPSAAQTAILIAGLMGLGLNLGLTQLAPATDFSADQLATIADWYIREETLRQALVILDNFVLHHPFSRHWGQGTTSSSDGLRVPVPVQTPNAMYNARYFGFKRGITIVTHAADIWLPFNTTLAHEAREALYVIDALCHHETDFDLQEHYTDTGGYTYHVFALCKMLGFQFSPRIRSITEQYLFTVEPTSVDASLQHLIKGQVEVELIKQNWDEMRRLAASIRHGAVSASLIMRKLAAYPKQNQLARAFNEVGKLERTMFVLSYLQDTLMQQRIRRGLNKGEAIHALERALSIGHSGEMPEREVDDQLNRTSCLMFLVSAISAWNTVYLDQVVSTLAQEGVTVPPEYLAHIAPLGWRHINLLGKYDFDLSPRYGLDKLRPLRKPSLRQ